MIFCLRVQFSLQLDQYLLAGGWGAQRVLRAAASSGGKTRRSVLNPLYSALWCLGKIEQFLSDFLLQTWSCLDRAQFGWGHQGPCRAHPHCPTFPRGWHFLLLEGKIHLENNISLQYFYWRGKYYTWSSVHQFTPGNLKLIVSD